MATVSVTCPTCFARFSVDESHMGKRGRCGRCDTAFLLSKPEDTDTKTAGASLHHTAGTGTRAGEAAVPELWDVGRVILGVYEVKWLNPADHRKHYAEGGVGIVYRVHHRGWDLDLAVKCPKREVIRTEQGARDFEGECATWIDLGLHPNIVTCYYVRRLGGVPRVFAEFVDGGSLREWVRTGRLYEGEPAEALRRILDIAIQFAWGLAYAHRQGVIHQDVKPGNVMMQGGAPKVTDFGLVRAHTTVGDAPAGSAPRDMLVSWAGMTPGYCSPEQARAALQLEAGVPPELRTKLNYRTDIWSWAVSLFELFHGKPPCRHGGHTAAEAFADYLYRGTDAQGPPPMPEGVRQLLGKCFRDEPDDRPENMASIAGALIETYEDVVGRPYPRQEPVTTELKSDGLNNRAVSLLDLGKVDEAAHFFEEAWQWHPWQPQVTHNRGLLLWRTGRWTDLELVSHLEDLGSTRPQQWEPAHSLAQVQLERGDVPAALQALNRVPQNRGQEIQPTRKRAEELARHTAQCVRTVRFDPASVETMYQASDDRLALSRADDETLEVWDVATGQTVLTFPLSRTEPLEDALTADGLFKLVGDGQEGLVLWDVAADQPAGRFERIQWGSASCVTADGGRELAAQDDFTIALREIASGRVLRSFQGHMSRVNSISLTGDERWMLTGSSDQTLRLWEIATGRCLRTFKGHTNPVRRLFISPDGTWAISMSTSTMLRLWNLGRLCHEQGRYAAPMQLCRITSAEEAGQVQSQFADYAKRVRQSSAAERVAEALDLAGEARRLAGYEVARESLDLWYLAGSRCRRIGLRDAWCARTLAGHAVEVTTGSLSSDGMLAVSGDWSGTLLLWDLATGRVLREFEGHADCIRAASFSRDSRSVISASWDRTVRVWDVGSGRLLRLLGGHLNAVNSAAFADDDRFAISGGWDETLRIWDTSSGVCVATLPGHTAHVNSVALGGAGLVALSGGEDNTLRLWDTAGQRCLRVLQGHHAWVTSVQLSSDLRLALSASKDGALRTWDLAKGHCLSTMVGHSGPVQAVCISSDGRWALSGGRDASARLWDLQSGQCPRALEGHADTIHAVSLSQDARWALTASKDTTLRLWELDWEFSFPGWADWDEEVRPHLEQFLLASCNGAPAGTGRVGRPRWNERDVERLLRALQRQGLGWVRPAGIRRELEKMTSTWQGPPPLPGA
jgi:predicted Zn finger-like uncharacterized protein